MFTIKHVGANGEALFSGDEIATENGGLSGMLRVSYRDGSEWKSLGDGVVYVMNREGATVAKYDMRVASGVQIKAAMGVVNDPSRQGIAANY